MSENDKSGEVVETRDVSELESNAEIEEEVDDMLGVPEDERPDRNLSVADTDDEMKLDAQETETRTADGADTSATDDDLRPEVREHMEKAREMANDTATDTATETESQPAADDDDSTEVTVSSLDDPDDHESFDFENQDWTLGESKDPEVREISGMKFLFREPEDDDQILNQLEGASDGDRWDQMFALVSLVIDKPEVTRDRWEDMNFSARLSLGSAAADYLELDEGFLDE